MTIRALATMFALLACVASAQRSTHGLPGERDEWLRDLARLEEYTATKYANFDWKVRHGVDPVALHARTDTLLRKATSTREARAALVAFVTAFQDGHFSARAIRRGPADGSGVEWPPRDAPALSLCRAFGYRAERSRTAFARLNDWRAISLPRLPFTAGVIEREGDRIAVLRIHSFGHEPHGWACESAWPEVQARFTGAQCDDACASALRRAIGDTLAAALAEAVRTLARERPSALIIDVTGNGGGTEWASKAARAITPRPLPAQRVAFIRNDRHRARLERSLARVDSALPLAVPGRWRDTLAVSRDRLAAAIELARTPCDRSRVWQLGVGSLVCDGLITGLWTAGPVPMLAPGFAPPGALTHEINSLAHSGSVNGGWTGPLVLVTDGASASATEQFVAELVDGAEAWVVGARTYGSGCGFTSGAEYLDLPAVGLRVRAPDCVRLRPDGTSEVAGIAPTHDARWAAGDGARVRAEKVIGLLRRVHQSGDTATVRHGWVVTLGRDTVQVEEARRVGNEITGVLITRAPAVRELRYRILLGDDSALRRYEQADVNAPSGAPDPFASVMEFTADSIVRHAVARGAAVTHRIAAPHGGFPFGTIPLGSSFQVLELAVAEARRATSDSARSLVRLSPAAFQQAPSRTRILFASADSVEIDYFGQGRFGVKLDALGRLIRSDWRGTTYQVRVERAADIDATAIAQRWREDGRNGTTFGALSPRDTILAQANGAAIRIIHGSPSTRGRRIWGGVVPWGTVWRLGADMATHFETSADLRLGASVVPAGRYTLWMLPTEEGAQLIVSRLVDVFGTQYAPARDLTRIAMVRHGLEREVERLSISVRDGQLIIAWGDAGYAVGLTAAATPPSR